MRLTPWLPFWTSLFTMACGASSTLSTDEGAAGAGSSDAGAAGRGSGVGTVEQQLSTKLQTWCPEICRTLSACPAVCSCRGDTCSCVDAPDPMTCPAECLASMSEEYLGRGDPCAWLGLTYAECLTAAGCGTLGDPATPPCVPDGAALDAACSPTAPAGSILCREFSGAASGGPITTPGTLVCDEQLAACTDGRVYRIVCTYVGNDQTDCSCLVDGAQERNFAGGTSCPPTQQVNLSCGWQLLPL